MLPKRDCAEVVDTAAVVVLPLITVPAADDLRVFRRPQKEAGTFGSAGDRLPFAHGRGSAAASISEPAGR